VYPITPAKGKTDSRLDQRAATDVFYLYNTAFLDGVCKGLVDADLDGNPDTAEPRPDLVGRMDYLGINYYTRVTVEGMGDAQFPALSAKTTFNPLTIEPWEYYPRGIYEVTQHVKERYGLPIIITETGAADPDDDGSGSKWITQHLEWVKRSMRDGADVRGFFYWTLMDNYEWNHGMDMKMGLYAVGTDTAKTRTARKSVKTYADMVKARDVTDEWLKQYPTPE